ncbi:MAG: hypothetical protein IT175_08065 [Acidobacteria bacterium]|nr:hypothetical protein [Acidobacteriota bacterium]
MTAWVLSDPVEMGVAKSKRKSPQVTESPNVTAKKTVPGNQGRLSPVILGQHGLRRRVGERLVRPVAIEKGFRTVCDRALATGVSILMPRIGCGLAGGNWSEIGPIVERTLCEHQVPVWVYDL